jgi:hypothetical protein
MGAQGCTGTAQAEGKTDREAVHWDSGGAEGAWYQITIQYPGYQIAESSPVIANHPWVAATPICMQPPDQRATASVLSRESDFSYRQHAWRY